MNATINGQNITFTPGETILSAARGNGHFIPSLCAFAPLGHAPESCRVCLVECVFPSGEQRLVPACSTPLEEGMRIRTNSPEARARQRLQVELLLADHDFACNACARRGNCELQTLAEAVGLSESRFRALAEARPRRKDDSSPALIMDPAKCVRCLRCAAVCRDQQGIAALAPDGEGLAARMGFVGAERWGDSSRCIQCGQCAMVCPVGAIAEKPAPGISDWLADPELVIVAHFPASVSVTIGEAFALPPGTNVGGLLAAALRRLGVRYVYATEAGTELAVQAEIDELTRRIENKGVLPMFSSLCPGWVAYVEKHRPELLPHLSGVPSPQAVFGHLVKTRLARDMGVDPARLRVVSLTPCIAAKGDALRPEHAADGLPETDAVFSVRECAKLLRARGINLAGLVPEALDAPFNTPIDVSIGASPDVSSGASALYAPSRHEGGVERREVTLRHGTGEQRITMAAPSEFGKIAPVLEAALAGTSPYAFINVMVCPGGCIGGGGTCRAVNDAYPPFAEERAHALRELSRF